MGSRQILGAVLSICYLLMSLHNMLCFYCVHSHCTIYFRVLWTNKVIFIILAHGIDHGHPAGCSVVIALSLFLSRYFYYVTV